MRQLRVFCECTALRHEADRHKRTGVKTMAKKEMTTTDAGQTQDTQPVKVDTRGRQRHVYGDVEKAWGSPVAEWTVDKELRIPARTCQGTDGYVVCRSILAVLRRNDPQCFAIVVGMLKADIAKMADGLPDNLKTFVV